MMCSLGLWVVLWPTMLCTGQAMARASLPPPIHYVADYADVIDTSHENELNTLLQRLEMNTGIPYIILTVQTVKEDSLSRFAKRTSVLWKLRQEGKDKGVLFVLNIQDNTYCYEVGRELRALLTKEVLDQVKEDVLQPCLKAGKVSEGIYQGNMRIIQRIASEHRAIFHDPLQPSSTPQPWQEKGSRSGWYGWMVVTGIVVAAGLGWGRTVRRLMRPAFPSCGFGTGSFGHNSSWSGGCFGGGFGAFGVGTGGFNPTQKNGFQTKDKLDKIQVA